jgi:hypothetical protein
LGGLLSSVNISRPEMLLYTSFHDRIYIHLILSGMKDTQSKTEPNYITAGLIEALAEIIYRYLKKLDHEAESK